MPNMPIDNVLEYRRLQGRWADIADSVTVADAKKSAMTKARLRARLDRMVLALQNWINKLTDLT